MFAVGTACAQGTRVQFPSTGSIGTAPATVPPVSGNPYGTPLSNFGSGGTLTGSGVPANSIPGSAGSIPSSAPAVFPPAGSSIPPTTTPSLGRPYSFDPYSTSPGAPNSWSNIPQSGGIQPPLGTNPFSTTPSTGGFSPPASPFS